MNMSSNFTAAPPRMTMGVYEGAANWNLDIVFGVVFVGCLLIALVGNVVIVVLLIRYRSFITANAFIILAVTLCISDILMVLFSGIPNINSLLHKRAAPPPLVCNLSGWVMNFNNKLNSFITTCICCVRCLVVVMPIRARILLQKKFLISIVGICVVIAACYSSLPYVFAGDIGKGQITPYMYHVFVGFCTFFIMIDDTKISRTLRILSTFLVEMVMFAPFIVAILTCSLLLYTLKRKNKYISVGTKNTAKRAAVIAIIKVTVLTLICVTPMLMFAIYDKINANRQLHWLSLPATVYLNYAVANQLTVYLRASINPFIIDMPRYLQRGKNMRKTAMAMKYPQSTTDQVITPINGNTQFQIMTEIAAKLKRTSAGSVTGVMSPTGFDRSRVRSLTIVPGSDKSRVTSPIHRAYGSERLCSPDRAKTKSLTCISESNKGRVTSPPVDSGRKGGYRRGSRVLSPAGQKSISERSRVMSPTQTLKRSDSERGLVKTPVTRKGGSERGRKQNRSQL